MDPRVRHEVEALTSGGFDLSVVGVALDGGRPGTSSWGIVDVAVAPLVVDASVRGWARSIVDLCRGSRALSGATSHRVERSSIGSLLLYNLWVARVALGRRWAVVHCHEHQSIPAAWLIARLARAQLVYDVHENTAEHRAGRGRKAALAVRLERWLVPRADLVLTVGERMASVIQKRFGRGAEVIGNWKPLSEYRLADEDRVRIRDKLGARPGDLVVGYVGSLNRDRHVRPLIEAVRGAPGTIAVIGGYGECEDELEATATSVPNVTWVGRVENTRVGELTAAFDVVYHCLDPTDTNHQVSAPNKLFEALAAGRSIIATDGVGELADLVGELGCGVLVPAATTAAIGDALAALRDDERRSAMAERARAAGERLYNADEMRDRLVAAYASLRS